MNSTPPPEQPGSPSTPPGFTAPGAAPVPPSTPGGPTPVTPPGAPQPGFGFLPGAPRPGIIPLRPLSLSEIFDGAFKAYRQNFGTMFGFSLLVTLLGGVFVLWNTWQTGNITIPKIDGSPTSTADLDALLNKSSGDPMTTLLGLSVSLVASIVLTGIIITVIANGCIGTRTGTGEAWTSVAPRLPALFGTTALTALLAVLLFVPGLALLFSNGAVGQDSMSGLQLAGILLLLVSLIAALFVWPWVYFAPAVCVLEKMSPWASITRGAKLVKGRFWSVWGVAVLAILIVTILQAVIGSVMAAPFMANAFISGELSVGARLANDGISLLLSALFAPFTGAVACLQYIDNRMRKEGLDVTLQQHAKDHAG